MPLREASNSGQIYKGTQYGTQHNPVEIDSSPEPKPGKNFCTTQSAPRQSQGSLGGYIREPDPAVKWSVYYAVARGGASGLYQDWCSAQNQVSGYSGGRQKKFQKQEDAWVFVNANRGHAERVTPCSNETTAGSSKIQPTQHKHMEDWKLLSSPPVLDTYTYTTPTPSSEVESPYVDHESEQYLSALEEPAVGSQPNSLLVHSFVPEPEPELSAEQRHVVDLIVEQGKNVFYTGSAGCGKSTILKAFVTKLKAKGKRVKIVAPTNLAALNVNGQTTWAFAGWRPDSMKQPLDKLKAAAHGKEIWERFESTDVLVIDEISMVENLQFERLNEIMKASLGARRPGPFGGVQIVVTGDVS